MSSPGILFIPPASADFHSSPIYFDILSKMNITGESLSVIIELYIARVSKFLFYQLDPDPHDQEKL